MSDGKPLPRVRQRAAPVPVPAPVRQRMRPARQVEEEAEIPAHSAAQAPRPRMAGAVGKAWHEVAGTEYDLFETRATSPYSFGGVAIGSPGGAGIRGFYHKDPERNRIAIYILTKKGDMKFVKWITGSGSEAMQEVSAAWKAAGGLHAPKP